MCRARPCACRGDALGRTGGAIPSPVRTRALDELVARRVAFLTDYQNAAYAQRYAALVERVRRADNLPAGKGELARAVANAWFKLLAAKDEWEVARLYTSTAFRQELEQHFEGTSPSAITSAAGRSRARTRNRPAREARSRPLAAQGLWPDGRDFADCAVACSIRSASVPSVSLRGALIQQYQADIDRVLSGLSSCELRNFGADRRSAMSIRGYGHIKQAAADSAARERERLWQEFAYPGIELRGSVERAGLFHERVRYRSASVHVAHLCHYGGAVT